MGLDSRYKYGSLSIALSDLLCSRLCCADRKIGNTYILRAPLPSDGSSSSGSGSGADNIGCVVGVHWPGLLVAMSLIAFGTLLNVRVVRASTKLDGAFLARECLYALIGVLFSSTCYNLYRTAFTDPGIVTKTSLHALGFREDETFLSSGVDSYCDLCDIVQPEEMKIAHCYSCDVCIGTTLRISSSSSSS